MTDKLNRNKLLEKANVNNNADCFDEPMIDIVDLSFGWRSDINAFTTNAICENCWTTLTVHINTVESKVID